MCYFAFHETLQELIEPNIQGIGWDARIARDSCSRITPAVLAETNAIANSPQIQSNLVPIQVNGMDAAMIGIVRACVQECTLLLRSLSTVLAMHTFSDKIQDLASEATGSPKERLEAILTYIDFGCALALSNAVLAEQEEDDDRSCSAKRCSKVGNVRCQQCRSAYCSALCQRVHWEKHKSVCKDIRDIKAFQSERLEIAKCGPFRMLICQQCGYVDASRFKTPDQNDLYVGEGIDEREYRTMLQCSLCKDVAYCCKECQVAHWKAGHKLQCIH